MPNKPIRGPGKPIDLSMRYYSNYLARLKGGRVKIFPFLAWEKPRLDITKALQYVSRIYMYHLVKDWSGNDPRKAFV
jgi:hypothetical protein